MSTDMDPTIRRILDRFEIEDLIKRWSRAASRCDWDALRECYHPGALDLHGATNASAEEFIQWMPTYHADIPQAIFYNTNVLIDWTGEDSALVESEVIVHQRYSEAAKEARIQFLGEVNADREVQLDIKFDGRYIDTFDRRDGKWKITKRIGVIETAQGTEAIAPLPEDDNGLTVSRRGRNDPLWAARAEAGLPDHLRRES